MKVKKYHKLVRDRIPEIIESDGEQCVCEVLSSKEYLALLDEKLQEELADLLEVMYAVVKARGWSVEELEQVRKEKAKQRGGFEKRILLKEVQSKD